MLSQQFADEIVQKGSVKGTKCIPRHMHMYVMLPTSHMTCVHTSQHRKTWLHMTVVIDGTTGKCIILNTMSYYQ